jgi:hypothetical protein
MPRLLFRRAYEYGRIQKNETAESTALTRDNAGIIKNGRNLPTKPIIGLRDVSFIVRLRTCFETPRAMQAYERSSQP